MHLEFKMNSQISTETLQWTLVISWVIISNLLDEGFTHYPIWAKALTKKICVGITGAYFWERCPLVDYNNDLHLSHPIWHPNRYFWGMQADINIVCSGINHDLMGRHSLERFHCHAQTLAIYHIVVLLRQLSSAESASLKSQWAEVKWR